LIKFWNFPTMFVIITFTNAGFKAVAIGHLCCLVSVNNSIFKRKKIIISYFNRVGYIN
jgi:hypothetical protein